MLEHCRTAIYEYGVWYFMCRGTRGLGSLREAGEERAGDGIPKGEIGNKFRNIVQLKHTEAGITKDGGGNREYKVREAGNSDPPPPPPRRRPHVSCFS